MGLCRGRVRQGYGYGITVAAAAAAAAAAPAAAAIAASGCNALPSYHTVVPVRRTKPFYQTVVPISRTKQSDETAKSGVLGFCRRRICCFHGTVIEFGRQNFVVRFCRPLQQILSRPFFGYFVVGPSNFCRRARFFLSSEFVVAPSVFCRRTLNILSSSRHKLLVVEIRRRALYLCRRTLELVSSPMRVDACMCVCLRACHRACGCVWVCARVRMCVHVRACVCAYV